MKKTIDFRSENPGRLLGRMAVPAIISMVVNGLYYLVDAAFVGIGVGFLGLAGLGLIFPVQMFVIAWGAMAGMGTASIISMKLGAGEHRSIETAVKTAVLISLISALLFTGTGFAFQIPILELLGSSESTLGYALDYMVPLQSGFIFVFFSMIGFNIARSLGKAREAGFGMILGTVVNLILDPLLIFGFKMGVSGAALATVIARIISSLYFLFMLKNSEGAVVKCMKKGLFSGKTASQIFSLGSGTFLGQICFSVIAVVVNKNLALYGSVNDVAAYGILSRIHVFITMPLLGLAQGFQPIAGYNFGAGEYSRVREVLRKSIAASVLIGIAVMIVPVLFPGGFLSLFTTDQAVVVAGIKPLRITLSLLPVIGFQIIGFSLFQATGSAVKTVILSLSRQILFLLPLLVLLPRFLGRDGIWLAYPIADGAAVVLSVIMIADFLRSRGRKQVLKEAGSV